MNSQQLLAEWLSDPQDIADERFAELVAAAEADADFSRLLTEQILIDHSLRLLLDPGRAGFPRRVLRTLASRQPGGSFRGRLRRRIHQRRRQRRLRIWLTTGLAAAILAAVTLLLVTQAADADGTAPETATADERVAPSGIEAGTVLVSIERGQLQDLNTRSTIVDGTRLPLERQVAVSPGGTVHLDFPEGVRISLGPQSTVSLHTDPAGGWQARFVVGELHFTADRPLQHPFSIDTGFGRLQVTGTAFRLALDATACEIAVAHGSVLIVDRQGAEHRLEPGRHLRLQEAPERTVLVQEFAQGLHGWRSSQTATRSDTGSFQDQSTTELTFSMQGAWYAISGRDLDASESDGLRLLWRGTGDGARYQIEVADDPDAPASGERFLAAVLDDEPGWRILHIPWSSFVSRPDAVNAHRRGTGIDPGAIHLIGVWRDTPGSGTVTIGALAAYRRVEALPEAD